nr:MAG TPA: hypothetical protein [Caudoviricetes sp.]
MAYAVVRTDAMAGTDVRGQLVSVKYMGANGATPTAIENGNVLKIGALMTGEREIYIGGAVAANDKIDDIVLIASPEVVYDEHKHNLDDFVNEAGKACRGYHIHSGDTFSVTAEALSGTGTPAVGNIVELAAGTKLAFVASATTGSTKVGRIIAVDVVGRYTYYVIKVD